jgi:hypothetical protein
MAKESFMTFSNIKLHENHTRFEFLHMYIHTVMSADIPEECAQQSTRSVEGPIIPLQAFPVFTDYCTPPPPNWKIKEIKVSKRVPSKNGL